jgi:hypothetical protein
MSSSRLMECGTCYDPYSYGIDNALQSAHRGKTRALLLVPVRRKWQPFGHRTEQSPDEIRDRVSDRDEMQRVAPVKSFLRLRAALSARS